MTNHKRPQTRSQCFFTILIYCFVIIFECSTIYSNEIYTDLDQSNATCELSESSLGKRLECYDGIEPRWLENVNYEVSELIFVSWPGESFPLNVLLPYFPAIETFGVYNSTFSSFDGIFPDRNTQNLQSLIFYGLDDLVSLSPHLFTKLKALKKLDIRGNRFTTIHPDLISTPPNLKEAYLKDNRWNCSDISFQWLAHIYKNSSEIVAKSRITDYKNLTCQGTMYPGKPVPVVMDILKLLHTECPKMCLCHLTNLVRDPHGTLVPVTTIDCRSKGLLNMPTNLPSITTILLLQGNNISELRPIVQNGAYKRVADIYLDNNRLTNVAPLEGADWMLNFRLLSLRGNNISQIPTYAFEHAFEYNLNIAHVYFGNNPWHCSCHFTPAFQELLLKYNSIFADLQDIRCETSEQSDISNVQVSTLSRSTVCHQPLENFHTVNIINILLASLITIVVGKFGYDYYYYKKSGKLPWISSKIP